MRKVKFIKDFATRKKGDIVSFDGMLASSLVHKHKVAKYLKEKEVE
jgi:hypothetical protein